MFAAAKEICNLAEGVNLYNSVGLPGIKIKFRDKVSIMMRNLHFQVKSSFELHNQSYLELDCFIQQT